MKGEVKVKGDLMPRCRQVLFQNLNVTPAGRLDTARLTYAGILEADGFPAMTLTLLGKCMAPVPVPGSIGAILVPDNNWAKQALDKEDIFLAGAEVATKVSPGQDRTKTYFSTPSKAFPVGFPRYRVYLYNTTDRTATADLSIYLGY